jgi:hypothetical protein
MRAISAYIALLDVLIEEGVQMHNLRAGVSGYNASELLTTRRRSSIILCSFLRLYRS